MYYFSMFDFKFGATAYIFQAFLKFISRKKQIFISFITQISFILSFDQIWQK